jgi:thiamine biosynthesis lipoprotein
VTPATQAVPSSRPVASVDRQALGVQVRLLLTDPSSVERATRLLDRQVAELDLACSRFRPDSELMAVNAAGGRRVRVSPLLATAIEVALQAAEATGGDVDPTLGSTLVRLGYDRDFAGLPPDGPPVLAPVHRISHWSQVQLDRRRCTVRLPAGVQLDLGATAKAWCADRTARRIQDAVGSGVLLSLGGDIAIAGPAPDGGWPIRVQDHPGPPDAPPRGPACVVSVHAGGLATSSTAARRWRRGGQEFHHVLDPRTGLPATSPWRTISVTATSCLAANIASTAAIVRGRRAVEALAGSRLPARLVNHRDAVTTLNGWPAETTT